MTKKKTPVKTSVKADETPVQAAPEKSASKPVRFSIKRAVIVTLLLIFTAIIWYYVAFYAFSLKNESDQAKHHADALADTAVVAVVDGKNITLGDVRALAKDIPQLSDLPFEMIYPQILNNMINTQVMLTGATKSDIEKNPDVVKALKLAREQILSQAYLSKQLEAEMTDEALQDLYKNEMRNFERQEEISARHILVGSKKEADDVIVQLKAGVDFAMLANQKSMDKDNKGGQLGYFTKNMMIPEFGNAVFAMKKGELSAPIKTPFGWHVVLVEDRRLAAPPAFEDVKDQLKQLYAERNLKRVIDQEWQKENAQILIPKID